GLQEHHENVESGIATAQRQPDEVNVRAGSVCRLHDGNGVGAAQWVGSPDQAPRAGTRGVGYGALSAIGPGFLEGAQSGGLIRGEQTGLERASIIELRANQTGLKNENQRGHPRDWQQIGRSELRSAQGGVTYE